MADFYHTVLGVDTEGGDTPMVLNTAGAETTIFAEAGREGLAPNSIQGAGHVLVRAL